MAAAYGSWSEFSVKYLRGNFKKLPPVLMDSVRVVVMITKSPQKTNDSM